MTAVPGKVPDPAPARLPQRPIGSRLRISHVAILGIGIVAAVLVYAALRGGSTIEVAVAAKPLAAGDRLEAASLRYETLRLPDGSGGLLTRTEAAAAVERGDRLAVSVGDGQLVTRSMVRSVRERQLSLLPIDVESVPPGIVARSSRVNVAVPRRKDPVLSDVLVWDVVDDLTTRQVVVLVEPGQAQKYNKEVGGEATLRIALILTPDPPDASASPAAGNG